MIAAVTCCAWEGVQGRFSVASHASIAAAIAVVVLLALVSGRGMQRKRSGTWVRGAVRALPSALAAGRVRSAAVAGALIWALLLAATIGWDAASFAAEE
ncbi:MAG: hypothetical protein ACRDXC_07020, partial [Acidimicrobiales bacterium]